MNRLAGVEDAKHDKSAPFFSQNEQQRGGTGGYSYDANGNMIQDNYKGILQITYNTLNLPVKLEFTTDKGFMFIEYAMDGTKMREVKYPHNEAVIDRLYCGGFEYEKSGNNYVLTQFPFAEGRAVPASNGNYNLEYFLKDPRQVGARTYGIPARALRLMPGSRFLPRKNIIIREFTRRYSCVQISGGAF